jgi:hypothetical protein
MLSASGGWRTGRRTNVRRPVERRLRPGEQHQRANDAVQLVPQLLVLLHVARERCNLQTRQRLAEVEAGRTQYAETGTCISRRCSATRSADFPIAVQLRQLHLRKLRGNLPPALGRLSVLAR